MGNFFTKCANKHFALHTASLTSGHSKKAVSVLQKYHVKTDLAWELIECNKYFDFIIIIICSTILIRLHQRLHQHDDNAWLFEAKGTLYQLIEKLSLLLIGSVTLFIINHNIAYESLDKQRQSLEIFMKCLAIKTFAWKCFFFTTPNAETLPIVTIQKSKLTFLLIIIIP